MVDHVLKVEALSVCYRRVQALDRVSLSMKPGDVVAVLGANGAGKSSLLNAIMGTAPCSGSVWLKGVCLDRLSVEHRVLDGLSLVPERRELFTSMTVDDNLMLGGSFLDSKVRIERIEEVREIFPRLAERRAQHAGTLSGGERQMLAMGRALVARPQVLMLDEPSLGLAPLVVLEVFKIIERLRAIGTSILLVEQNAQAALRIADYAYVLELGVIKHHGPARDMLNDPRLNEAYLGL